MHGIDIPVLLQSTLRPFSVISISWIARSCLLARALIIAILRLVLSLMSVDKKTIPNLVLIEESEPLQVRHQAWRFRFVGVECVKEVHVPARPAHSLGQLCLERAIRASRKIVAVACTLP